MKALALSALILAATASNDAFLSGMAAEQQARWRVVLLAECMSIENGDVKAILRQQREAGSLPPFDMAWCIAQGVFPSRLFGDGRQS